MLQVNAEFQVVIDPAQVRNSISAFLIVDAARAIEDGAEICLGMQVAAPAMSED